MSWAGRRLHFIAIGGAGMSGLALVAHALGAQVTGSDRAESSYLAALREEGIAPVIGHAPEHVPAGDDVEVVVSTAIGRDNPELVKRSQEALARKGLYHGLADGKFSPAMGDALREFQKTARLDPTGIPDTATLWVLLNP